MTYPYDPNQQGGYYPGGYGPGGYGPGGYGPDPYGYHQPYPQPGGYPDPYGGYPDPYGGYPPPPPGNNGMAVAAMVCSLVGIACCGVLSIIGAILGHVALNQINQTGQDGRGMAMAGIIIGWTMFGLSLIFSLIYFVALGASLDDLSYAGTGVSLILQGRS